jgi:hypothetical protein
MILPRIACLSLATLPWLIGPSLAADAPAPPLPAANAETAGGWVKYEQNPVLGGKYGTCFDIAVLRDGGLYRMWVSWRPQRSLALVESRDGIHWSQPPRIVLGPRKETGWEDDINRPVVVKRSDGYHLWYTGQAKGHSWIGYVTSPDGLTWKRMSVSARDLGRAGPPLAHVVFRRRAIRAERHRLRHQSRWLGLD